MKHTPLLLASLLVLLLLTGPNHATAARPSLQDEPIADMQLSSTAIRWTPHRSYAALILTIAAPDGTVVRQEFGPGVAPALDIAGIGGRRGIDGIYTYELRAAPILDAATRRALAAAAASGDRTAIVERLRREGQLPAQLVQSGNFQIANGAFVSPGRAAEPTHASEFANVAPQDVVTPDDQIVQGSLCVGFDCVDGESFGFDTVRLKENNTRLKFDDTSASAGFPANDWQLTANDSASGGVNKFSIEDITGVKVPLTIIAGAPSDSIHVSSSGRLGLRTSTPALDIHMNTSDTPAIRFEQNNAVGFSAQTWDVGANEANFFIRDLTAGSRLPFRVRPGAPTSSIDIAASGNVGIGTAAPTERLHVNGNVQVEGRIVELSDARAKQDFRPIDGRQVLLLLRAVPINTWRYRADTTGERHIGPTAQDFFAAFGLGGDAYHIAPLDANGVALAAIQELDRMVAERDARIAALEHQQAQISERLARLERMIAAQTGK
jgi:hypothetical protein